MVKTSTILVGKAVSVLCLAWLIMIVGFSLVYSGCGGSRSADNPPPTSCMGLQCAVITTQTDMTCPQVSGHNYRWYGAATSSNLTVYLFYLLEQYDEQGNETTFQKSAKLTGAQEVPLACHYSINAGIEYQNDIAKE